MVIDYNIKVNIVIQIIWINMKIEDGKMIPLQNFFFYKIDKNFSFLHIYLNSDRVFCYFCLLI